MPVNINEIKKLPDFEKLRLIDELLNSIDDTTIEEYLSSAETNIESILMERWELFETGKMKFSPLEEVEKKKKKNSDKRNIKRN